jgi:hypothetical protein
VTLEAVLLREEKAPDSFDDTEDFPPGRLEVSTRGPEDPLASLITLPELEESVSDCEKSATITHLSTSPLIIRHYFLHSTQDTNLFNVSDKPFVVLDTAFPASSPALDTPFPTDVTAPATALPAADVALPAADVAALAFFPIQSV